MYLGEEIYSLVQETVETESKRLSRKIRLWMCNFSSSFIGMRVLALPLYFIHKITDFIQWKHDNNKVSTILKIHKTKYKSKEKQDGPLKR